MARKGPKIYVHNRAVKIILKSIGILALAFVVLAVSLFFGLKRYAVYTPQGVHLEIPWLEE